MSKKIKVLIVDDSAIVRDLLEKKISEHPDMEVVGTAMDPYVARDKIVRLNPHVITLDIEMPRMDGLTFLQKLMKYYPVPVIIVSSLLAKDSLTPIKALELGAFDVVAKPHGSISVQEVTQEIVQKIRLAYQSREGFLKKASFFDKNNAMHQINRSGETPLLSKITTTQKFILIGASTGGTVALEFILRQLPSNMPPILIVQHMPPYFTNQFAQRLNELTSLSVKEAEEGESIISGHVYIAMGGRHLTLHRKGSLLYAAYEDSERVHFQKPAADVMFSSAAKLLGRNALGVLLTGMGKDGGQGLLNMKNAGSYTIAQDEESSVVWGMPKTAIDLGATHEVLALKDIPSFLIKWSSS